MNILFLIVIISWFIFLFIYLPVHIYRRKKAGKIKKRLTYSYKSLYLNFLKYFPVVLVAIFLIYLLTRDVEVTTGLGVFILSCYIAGFLRMFHFEYKRKRAGGEEKDWE